MIAHPRVFVQQLTPGNVESVYRSALRVLERTGMIIQSDEACGYLARAGASVESPENRVRFPQEIVERCLAEVPSRWTLHARNPQRTVEIGRDKLLLAPGYGAPFVVDAQGRRRRAIMEDFKKFALLACQSDVIDITGGVLVEPDDVPVPVRPLELVRALLTYSDKPFMGSVAGTEEARHSLEMAEIVFGNLTGKPVLIGLININSPLRLEALMAGAFLEYVKAGQPVLLTPGVMMGLTAPVTLAGTLVQAFAELIGCVAVSQMIRPGTPVIIGTAGFGSDLRHAGSGLGRPENALSMVLGAQMARKLGIPYRASAAVTGAFRPDCRSGYERMMTAMSAWAAGAHLCLQAAGTLDCINSMCLEQFVVDLEIWSYLKRLSQQLAVDDETLAVHVIADADGDYLNHEHTLRHLRDELYVPMLIPPESYESWLASDGPDVIAEAARKGEDLLRHAEPPLMDDSVKRDLENYVIRCRERLRAS